MSNKSSKDIMEGEIEILSKIRSVEAPNFLLENILKRYQKSKEPRISLVWVRGVAAVFLCIFFVEIYGFTQSKKETQSELISLVNLPDNFLYNE